MERELSLFDADGGHLWKILIFSVPCSTCIQQNNFLVLRRLTCSWHMTKPVSQSLLLFVCPFFSFSTGGSAWDPAYMDTWLDRGPHPCQVWSQNHVYNKWFFPKTVESPHWTDYQGPVKGGENQVWDPHHNPCPSTGYLWWPCQYTSFACNIFMGLWLQERESKRGKEWGTRECLHFCQCVCEGVFVHASVHVSMYTSLSQTFHIRSVAQCIHIIQIYITH